MVGMLEGSLGALSVVEAAEPGRDGGAPTRACERWQPSQGP